MAEEQKQKQIPEDLFSAFRKVTPTSIIDAVENKREVKAGEKQEEFEPNSIEELRAQYLKDNASTENDEEEDKEEIPAELPDKGKKELTEIVAEEEETEENLYYVFAQQLADKGIIEFDTEKKDISEDDIFNTIQDQIAKGIDEYKNSMSEEARKAIEHLNTYGNLNDFQTVYQDIDYSKVDPEKVKEDEDGMKFLIAQKLLTIDGEDEASVEETIADLEASGLLYKTAIKALDKLTKSQVDKKAFLENKRVQDEKLKKERFETEMLELKNKIVSSPDIAGFVPDKKTRESFFDFVTRKDPKTKKTQLESFYEDKDNQLKMAFYLFNKFDFSKFEKQVQTTKVSKLKDLIDRENKNKSHKTGSRTRAGENQEDPLASFRKLN